MSVEDVDSKEQATPTEATPRPSRQKLVVPRQHSMPVITGAVVCAVAGFGLVFALGLGRRMTAPQPSDDMATAAPATMATDQSAPDLLPPPDAVATASTNRWQRRGTSDDAGDDAGDDASPAGDRYSARPVSHDRATPVQYRSEDQQLSRFSSPDLPPLHPAADIEPPPAAVPASMPDDEATEPPMAEAVDEPAAAVVDTVPTVTVVKPSASPVDDTASMPAADTHETPLAFTPPAESLAAQPEPASSAAAPPAMAKPAPPDATVAASPEPATSKEPPVAEAARPEVVAAADPSPIPIPPPANAPELAGVTVQPSAPSPGLVKPLTPPAVLPPSDVPPSMMAATQSRPTAIPVGLPVPSPFATAPPVGLPPSAVSPTPGASPLASPPSFARSPQPLAGPILGYDDEAAVAGPSPLTPPPAINGQAVPGPIQLEGVQTPQVAVEKRGPREIQVGRAARYEIIVRNVGTATAHDVALRDAVPRGTSLIATTPPAAPAEGSSDLIWALGELPPGGEARVLMELMPETEGEIGSIASVSFRADATMRSVATKPALAIDCKPLKPVRIGGDIPVTLTLSNPGTGVATGVVLEGYLPDTVSHRAGTELEFDVGQLRPGETRTIDLVLGTRGPGHTPMRLVSRADGGVETTVEVPLEVTAPTLEIAIDMPNRRFLQRPATCTIAMMNSGTAAARSVELAVQMPPGMKFVRANNAGWHDERTHRVLWNLEELPAGETGRVEVVMMPIDAGEQRIVAAARSTDGPSDQALHSCQVEGLAAVSYQVADSEDPVEVGGLTEYVIRVANEGTKAATGVQVAATLVGDLEPVEASGPGGHRVENLTVAFEPLAKLGAGEEAVYRVRARGLRAGHQRIQVRLVSEDQPNPITKEETTSVYDDR